MKGIIRRIAIYTFTLFLLPSFIPGLDVSGGFRTLIIGGTALALMFMLLKPILSIISFPINLITLGLFSTITNAFILYLLTRFINDISLTSFTYKSFTFSGFVVPSIEFNIYFAYIFTAVVISLLETALKWLME